MERILTTQINDAWIKAVSPEIFVISAGVHAGYLHPKSIVIQGAISKTSKSEKYHLLQYSGSMLNNNELITFGKDKDYYHSVTTSHVYNTTNQGDIVIDMGEAFTFNSLPETEFNKSVMIELSSLLLKTIEQKSYLNFLVELYLDNIGLTDVQFVAIAKNTFSVLRMMSLKNNQLSSGKILSVFIEKHKKLSMLLLEGNPLEKRARRRICKGWAHRGLSF